MTSSSSLDNVYAIFDEGLLRPDSTGTARLLHMHSDVGQSDGVGFVFDNRLTDSFRHTGTVFPDATRSLSNWSRQTIPTRPNLHFLAIYPASLFVYLSHNHKSHPENAVAKLTVYPLVWHASVFEKRDKLKRPLCRITRIRIKLRIHLIRSSPPVF